MRARRSVSCSRDIWWPSARQSLFEPRSRRRDFLPFPFVFSSSAKEKEEERRLREKFRGVPESRRIFFFFCSSSPVASFSASSLFLSIVSRAVRENRGGLFFFSSCQRSHADTPLSPRLCKASQSSLPSDLLILRRKRQPLSKDQRSPEASRRFFREEDEEERPCLIALLFSGVYRHLCLVWNSNRQRDRETDEEVKENVSRSFRLPSSTGRNVFRAFFPALSKP